MLFVEMILALAASVIAMLANLIRATRGGARRHHYAVTGIVAGYVVVVYALASLGVWETREAAPVFLRLANILIIGSLAANPIAHWREDGRR